MISNLELENQGFLHAKGIGVDIVEIERVKNLIEKYDNRFIQRILGIEELSIFHSLTLPRNIRFAAKRFAAKEAISKALGTGIGDYSFKDIQILNLESGKPYVKLKGFKANNILISISDEKKLCIAFAICM